MKGRLLTLLLLISSLIVYLIWGNDNCNYLWEMEITLFKKAIQAVKHLTHPLVLLPLFGQLLLIVSIFKKRAKRIIRFIGMFHLSVLILLIFSIGLFSGNAKISLLSLPFVVVCTLNTIEFIYFKR